MKKLTLLALLLTSLISLPALAQQPDKAAPAVKAAPLKESAAVKGLRTEQAAFSTASKALAPDSMTRPKGDKADVAILTETFPKAAQDRRAHARKIAAHAAELKREAIAAKADASVLRAIDGLIADARAVEASVDKLIDAKGKAPGPIDVTHIAASDAQAKRLQASLASTLGLLEPIIMR
jgi:hypothetical protein